MVASALLLIHLVAFAAYLGAGFAQLQLMKRSRTATPEVRADHERLAAGIITKIELPAIMGSIASGIGFVMQNPAVMKLGWLHGKLACVLLLAILSHAEMFTPVRPSPNLRRPHWTPSSKLDSVQFGSMPARS